MSDPERVRLSRERIVLSRAVDVATTVAERRALRARIAEIEQHLKLDAHYKEIR